MTGVIILSYLPIMTKSLQQPPSSFIKVAVVEGFDCIIKTVLLGT